MLAQLFALLPLLAVALASPIDKRATGQLIQVGRNPGQCLSVDGGRDTVSNGRVHDATGVVSQSCDTASLWDISRGSGSVIVSGTNYALDIGLNPGNNGNLKVWTSYPGAPQQTWYLTDDNRIAQTGGNQCLDQGDNGLQTYQCTTGNTNQVFTVGGGGGSPPAISSSVAPSPSATASPSTTSSASGPVSSDFNVLPGVTRTQPFSDLGSEGGIRIRPVGRPDLCVGVANDNVYSGAPLVITRCFNDKTGYADTQLWKLNDNRYNYPRQIQLASHPELCLDAGSNPDNGGGMKVYQCYDNLAQQQWNFNTGLQFKTANNQCLDIKKESNGRAGMPYDSFADMQTWQCSTNSDPYQNFAIEYAVYDNM